MKYVNLTDEKQNIDEYVPTKAVVDKLADKSVLITLPASGWSANTNTQTVTVNGVSADESKQLIIPMPKISSQNAYYEALVMCTGFAANSLTFTCDEIPTEDLSVYIYIKNVLG